MDIKKTNIFMDFNTLNKPFLDNLYYIIETDKLSPFQWYIGIADTTDIGQKIVKNRYEDDWTHNFVYSFVWWFQQIKSRADKLSTK